MALEIATWVLRLIGVYLAAGLLFAPPFLFSGVRRIDPAASEGTTGFRLLILPGVVALWPLLLTRWVRGVSQPPEERGAHRQPAGGRS